MDFTGHSSKKYHIKDIRKGLEEEGALQFGIQDGGWKLPEGMELGAFVSEYFSLQRKYKTYDEAGTEIFRMNGNRSFVDIYRTCMHYYPGVSVNAVRKALAECFEGKNKGQRKIGGHFCNIPRRFVMYRDGYGEIDDTVNEFGWNSKRFFSLPDILKNKEFKKEK